MSNDKIRELIKELRFTRHLTMDLFTYIMEKLGAEAFADPEFQMLRDRMVTFGFIGEGEASGG